MKTKTTPRYWLFSCGLLLVLLSGQMPVGAQANKSVFAELFGNGLAFSANFDTRLSRKVNGFGLRAGVGYFPGTIFNSGFVTLPLGINHLAGKGPHYLETGAGITLLPGGIKVFGSDEFKVKGVLFIPSAGYRYAAAEKGFQGRLVFTPWIGEGGVQFMGGASAGFTF